MIGSVFAGTVAFSGAAAAGTLGNVDVTSNPSEPVSTSTTFQLNIDADADSDIGGSSLNSIQINPNGGDIDFSNVEQPDIVTLDVGATDATGDIDGVSASNNGGTLDISLGGAVDITQGDEITVEFRDAESPSTEGDYSVTIEVNDNSAGTGILQVTDGEGTREVFVSQPDNDPDDSPQDKYDEKLTSSGGPYWQGQKLAIKNSEAAGAELQLREADDTDDGEEVGSFVSDLTLNNNGEAIIDTSNREGDYVVTRSGGGADGVYYFSNGLATDPGTGFDTDGTVDTDNSDGNENRADIEGSIEEASFEITVQSLSATFSGENPSEASQTDESFIELNSNRAGYVVTVTADQLDNDELANLFASEFNDHEPAPPQTEIGSAADTGSAAISNYRDGSSLSSQSSLTSDSQLDDDTIAFQVDNENANVTLNFSEVDTGDYTLNFEVADTDASASDSISVVEDDDADAEILNPIVRAGEGDNAVIPIQLSNTDEGTVNVGYNDVNFNLTFDIEDGNDDDIVTAGIDLYTVGRADLGALTGVRTADPGGTSQFEISDLENLDELDGYDDSISSSQLDSGPFAQLTESDGTTIRDFDGDGSTDSDDRATAIAFAEALIVTGDYAGTSASVQPVDDDDTINNINLTAYEEDGNTGDIFIDDPPLDNADYDINVTDGGVAGTELAVATMDVTQTVQDGLRSWTMSSANFEDLDNDPEDALPEVYEAVGNGQLTEDDTIAENDILVLQYRGTGVFGGLAAAKDDSEDYDEAFVELLRADAPQNANPSQYGYATDSDSLETAGSYVGDFDLIIEQSNPAANRDPKVFDIAETFDENGMRVLPDQANSSLFIFFDEAQVDVDRGEAEDRAAVDTYFDSDSPAPSATPPEVDVISGDYDVSGVQQTDLKIVDGERYEANLSIADGALNNDDVLDVTTDVEFVEETLTYDTNEQDIIQVAAQSGQVISGSTSVAPGTELNLRIRSTGASPFLRSPQPIVQPDGTFNTTVDFSTVAENTSFTASARRFDDDDTEVPGVVGEAPVAQVRIDDQSGDGTTVTVRSVTMSEGGFVVIHDSTLLDGQVSESVIGSSDYLSEGQSTNVEITLDEPLGSNQQLIAMPHLDTNGNQAYDFPSADGPYTANGSAVTDSAQYTIATPTATPDTTTTMPTTTEPTTTTEAPDTPTETDEPGTTAQPDTTTTGGPGFTAGIALVALAAAALLALRRRD